MADDPYKYFRVEARELVDELVKGILGLDKGDLTASSVAGILRHTHTLKGAARVVKQPEIADHAHAIEEALDPHRESTEPVPQACLEIVLGFVDAIRSRVAALPLPDEVPRIPSERTQPDEPVRTIRAEVAEMDILLDGVGEAHAQLSAARSDIRGIGRARGLVDLIASQLTIPRATDMRHVDKGDRAKKALLAAEELQVAVATLEQNLENDIEQLDQELRQIRDAVERLRLVPARALFTDLERAARDVAQTQAKRVVFEGRGGEVRLDAHVLAAAQAALQQLVRNAVAHGIETDSERRAIGKSPDGHVLLEISQSGRRAVFACSDDGRGIDLEAVRSATHRKGLHSGDTASLGPEDLMRLLLSGGISTSSTVTELSGRGIGLDVARDSAARLGGEITVTTEAGKGTTVRLEVPLSLTSFDALAVEAAGVPALIPLDAVLQIVRVRSEEIYPTSQGEGLTYNGKVAPYLRLSSTLSEETAAARIQGASSVVIVTGKGGVVAIGVHRLLGTLSIVVRPLPDFVTCSPVVSSVWLDEEGNPRLVLDPEGLVAEAQRDRERIPAEDDAPLSPILIIDDSLTTRMLEQSILESAGYTVEVASSGEEGLVKARGKQYLLFLVDVEMPGIDGFTFIERAKSEPTLRDIPAILVTSRSSLEDQQRGFDAGASAYITKGEFDQGKLLGRIKTLTVR
jgi:two-component system chemotaxis sensor kinase CheA